MGDVVQNIASRFSVKGAPAYAASMKSIGTASAVAGGAIDRATRLMNPLKFAIAGAVGGITLAKVASLGSEFEDTQRTMAGLFSTFGMAGNFNEGLKLAERTLWKIKVDAAALPGEAEDYFSVFKQALPQLRGAFNSNADDMVSFANRYTAIMSTLGVHSSEAAMSINKMLAAGRGQANEISASFRAMLPFMSEATRGTKKMITSAADFNKLTLKQRTDVLKLTLEQKGLVEMLEAASESWDAQSGAFVSITKALIRLGSAPLFETMKEQLGAVNALLMDSEGNLTAFGNTLVGIGNVISKAIGFGMEKIVDAFTIISAKSGAWLRSMADSPVVAALAGAAGNMGKMMSERGVGHAAAGGGAVAGLALGGPIGGIVGVMLGGLASNSNALAATFSGLESIALSVVGALQPLMGWLIAVTNVIGSVAASTLPHLIGALSAIIDPVLFLAAGFFGIAAFIAETLQPGIALLTGGLAKITEGLLRILMPVIKLFGAIAIWVFDKFYRMMAPAVNSVIEALGSLADWIGEFLLWLGELVGKGVEQILPGGGAAEDEPQFLRDMRAFLDGLGKPDDHGSGDAVAGSTTPNTPAVRGGGNTTQDFRFSRFDISQKFAEGFDPDRIAVAFAQDLGRIGEQRLQSGFEPALASR